LRREVGVGQWCGGDGRVGRGGRGCRGCRPWV
jgi:hypothetical protein